MEGSGGLIGFFVLDLRVTQIDRGVSKGAHYVVCELQGQPGVDKGKFKIYGVL
jgi:hypothetical protein